MLVAEKSTGFLQRVLVGRQERQTYISGAFYSSDTRPISAALSEMLVREEGCLGGLHSADCLSGCRTSQAGSASHVTCRLRMFVIFGGHFLRLPVRSHQAIRL